LRVVATSGTQTGAARAFFRRQTPQGLRAKGSSIINLQFGENYYFEHIHIVIRKKYNATQCNSNVNNFNMYLSKN